MEAELELAERDSHTDGGAWPAFTDLMAATTLLFLILFAAIAIPALRRAGQAEGRERTMALIQTHLDSALRDQHVTVKRVGDYLLVRISGNATFPRSKDQLPSLAKEGRTILRTFGKHLSQDKAILAQIDQIQVVGHTSTEGPDSTNWRLSSTRAASVALFLIDSAHISPCKISALGRSRYYPAAKGRPVIDSLDRRIELEVHPVVVGDSVQAQRRASCRG